MDSDDDEEDSDCEDNSVSEPRIEMNVSLFPMQDSDDEAEESAVGEINPSIPSERAKKRVKPVEEL
jgi:hypothetical protein